MSLIFPNSINDAQTKQRVSQLLQPNEVILWLGKPATGSTISPLIVGLAVLLVVAGVSLFAGLYPMLWSALPAVIQAPFSFLIGLANKPTTPALILCGAGFALGAIAWYRRSSKWSYAITNSRVLVVFGSRLLREKTARQLKYVRVRNRRGNRADIYWEIRTAQHKTSFDDQGQSLNPGPDGQYVGFKGQENAEQLCADILEWQKRSIEGELDEATISAQSYLANVDSVGANHSIRNSSYGSQVIKNRDQGYSIEVPAGWATRVSQRKKGILPFLKISFLDSIYRDGAFIPYAQDLSWNLLISQGTEESWLEIYSAPGALSTDWNTVINDPWAARLGQKVINQDANLTIGKLKGFSITRSMPEGVVIQNYGTTKTKTHLQMTWLSDGRLALEFRAIVPAHSNTLQKAIAMIPATLLTGALEL